jgi:hypothetical protein
MKLMKTEIVNEERFDVHRRAGRRWLLARENGADVCRLLEQRARSLPSPLSVLVLDFVGVEAMTFSFADEFVGRYLALRGARVVPETGIVLAGLNDDTREEVEAVLRHRDVAAVNRAEAGSRLLSADAQLEQTYELALLLSSFSALQLAGKLGITPQNANNRLKRLHDAGAVHRTRAQVDRGGKEFVYAAVR